MIVLDSTKMSFLQYFPLYLHTKPLVFEANPLHFPASLGHFINTGNPLVAQVGLNLGSNMPSHNKTENGGAK